MTLVVIQVHRSHGSHPSKNHQSQQLTIQTNEIFSEGHPWQIQSCSQESRDIIHVSATLGSLEPSPSKRRHQQDGGITCKNGGQRGSLQTTTQKQVGKPGKLWELCVVRRWTTQLCGDLNRKSSIFLDIVYAGLWRVKPSTQAMICDFVFFVNELCFFFGKDWSLKRNESYQFYPAA